MFKNFNRRLRNIFLTGFLITLPIALTIFILSFLFKSLDALSPVFTHWLILLGAPIPEGYRIPFLGVVMTFVIVFLVGAVTTNIFGKKILHLWEEIIGKIPFVRRIYKGTKQVVSRLRQWIQSHSLKWYSLNFREKELTQWPLLQGKPVENFNALQVRTI